MKPISAKKGRACPLKNGQLIKPAECGATRPKGNCPPDCEYYFPYFAELERERLTPRLLEVEVVVNALQQSGEYYEFGIEAVADALVDAAVEFYEDITSIGIIEALELCLTAFAKTPPQLPESDDSVIGDFANGIFDTGDDLYKDEVYSVYEIQSLVKFFLFVAYRAYLENPTPYSVADEIISIGSKIEEAQGEDGHVHGPYCNHDHDHDHDHDHVHDENCGHHHHHHPTGESSSQPKVELLDEYGRPVPVD